MDYTSTIIGAVISFISSIGILIVERLFEKFGKLRIYTKIVYDRSTGSYTWGFRDTADGLVLNVPLWLEVVNHSKRPRILRDINLLIASRGKVLTPMLQINYAKTNDDNLSFANEGSYSLSINGDDVRRIVCHYCLKANHNTAVFDEILLRYFDEKGRAHTFSLGYVEGDWHIKEFPRNETWIELKEKRYRNTL